MTVRSACKNDLPAVVRLLRQVLEVHAAARPDLFRTGTRKYTDEELLSIFSNNETPVFVAVDESERVCGYCFCEVQNVPQTNCMYAQKTLYIDDLCVEEAMRGRGVGRLLLQHVRAFAASKHCDALTLQVWAGNDGAAAFYEAMGFSPRKTVLELSL